MDQRNRNLRIVPVGIIALFALLILMGQSLFVVDETNQAIITQFGQYRRTASAAGLHIKMPFVQNVAYLERRVLSSDATAQEYLTLDKKRAVVDHITRWRIVDPLQFYVTVGTEMGARARLDDIVFSELRQELALHNLDEIIADQRDSITDTVVEAARTEAASFGISIVDVQMKRADLPPAVQESVFNRMVAERQRESSRYRAEGEERAARIRAEAERERTVILADAQEEAQRTRGEGDAEAIAIYAEALEQDLEFYAFTRRLEAYRKLLGSDDVLVLDAGDDFFRYLTSHDSLGEEAPAEAATLR